MKKVLLLALAAFIFASCSKTLNEKAADIIKEKIIVETGDTYTPIKTLVDSAYSPMDNPELYKLFDKYMKGSEDVKKHITALTEKGNILGRYTDRYSEEVTEEMEPIVKSIENSISIMENMDRMLDMEKQFVGYKVVHTYKNMENGKEVEHQNIYMFDKEMSTIVYQMPYKEYVFANMQMIEAKETLKTKIESFRKILEEVN